MKRWLWLAVACGSSHDAGPAASPEPSVVATATPTVVGTPRKDGTIKQLAVSRDGKTVVALAADGAVVRLAGGTLATLAPVANAHHVAVEGGAIATIADNKLVV